MSAPYGVEVLAHTIPATAVAADTIGCRVTLRNTGGTTWTTTAPHPVDFCVFVDDVLYQCQALPVPAVETGGEVTWHFAWRPPAVAGPHRVRIELVHQHVTWFHDQGVTPLDVVVEITEAPSTVARTAADRMLKHNLWHYLPTQGIGASRSGEAYPLFISKSKGCRMWDPDGREFIDFTSGWGSTILGHADDRIQQAIASVLAECGPLPPFPHPFEMDVSAMIAEDFAPAEMVVFGKNGSDMCSLAARMARISTGKRVILSCGFHGWQDFAIDYFDFAHSGIPERPRSLFKFDFNSPASFFALFEQHRGDLAAVMLEPSGPYSGDAQGLAGDIDRQWLAEIIEAARSAGALVIFDEIITGYRYPGLSVQRATGMRPDLTCLGKALASGMPLSALAGSARIFHDTFFKTHYSATFKGEVYAFAAARRAIEIYRSEPVGERVWSMGEQLIAHINAASEAEGLSARSQGPPFRFGLTFKNPDEHRRRQQKTLLTQHLLRRGIVTVGGIMLPNWAHDERALTETRAALTEAIGEVGDAERRGDYDRRLEIPLLH